MNATRELQSEWSDTLGVAAEWTRLGLDEMERTANHWLQLCRQTMDAMSSTPAIGGTNLTTGMPEWMHDAAKIGLAQMATAQEEFAELCQRSLDIQGHYQSALRQGIAASTQAAGPASVAQANAPSCSASEHYQRFIRDYGSVLDSVWKESFAAMLTAANAPLHGQSLRRRSGYSAAERAAA